MLPLRASLLNDVTERSRRRFAKERLVFDREPAELPEPEARCDLSDGGFGRAAFYSYAYPEPGGFCGANVAPPARYDATLREFILPYEEVRQDDDPEAMLLSFLQSTYVAAAELGGWDRDALEVPTEILRAVEGW